MIERDEQSRWAIYFTPEKGSELDCFAQKWLGRDEENMGTPPSLPEHEIDSKRYHHAINAPRHYGFHGTLKAPFLLHPRYSSSAIDAMLETFSATFAPFFLSPLHLKVIGNCIAFVTNKSKELENLHRRLTVELDILRAPLTEFDKARFTSRGLSNRQKENLLQYGYPYVMEDFLFHLTLTGKLPKKEQQSFLQLLAAQSSAVREKRIQCSHVSLFSQESRQSPFFLVKKYSLQGK